MQGTLQVSHQRAFASNVLQAKLGDEVVARKLAKLVPKLLEAEDIHRMPSGTVMAWICLGVCSEASLLGI